MRAKIKSRMDIGSAIRTKTTRSAQLFQSSKVNGIGALKFIGIFLLNFIDAPTASEPEKILVSPSKERYKKEMKICIGFDEFSPG